MDTLRDFPAFRDIVDDLNAVLRDGFKASDATVRGLFDALRDVPIDEIRANAKRIIATATRDTAFPKPRDLRNRPAVIEAPPPSAAAEVSARRNQLMWRELRARDPIEYEILFRVARTARDLAQLDEADPGYAECAREHHRWNALRYAARAEQETLVAVYLGRP
jgi:hypothetical protein